MDWQQTWETVQNWLTNTGIKVLISIVIMIVTFSFINFLSKKIAKRADKKVEENKKIDKTIYKTLSYVVKVGLKVLVVVCLIGYLGIDTSGITALLASLGVGVGLAINGTLSNFAGGIMILIHSKTTIISKRAATAERLKTFVSATRDFAPRTTKSCICPTENFRLRKSSTIPKKICAGWI